MKANAYRLIERCVEDGVSLGYNRAFKHNDNPSQAHIEDQIIQAIMTEVCEWFDFNEHEQESI